MQVGFICIALSTVHIVTKQKYIRSKNQDLNLIHKQGDGGMENLPKMTWGRELEKNQMQNK